MSSNVAFKTSFMCSERENFQKSKKEAVRSDFLLKSIFAYMIEKIYKFDTISAKNKKEKDTIESVKRTFNEFKDEYGSQLREQCLEIHLINEDTIDCILSDISNEIFSEGITQIKIITYFALVGELTRMVIYKKLPKTLVNVIFNHFSKFVYEKLELWIQEHGGWESIFIKKEDKLKFCWVKCLVHSILKIMGTISDLQNMLNGNMVFELKAL